jgi:hypothetical protein
MMFAGNVKWRKSIFDTTGAPWQNVSKKHPSGLVRSRFYNDFIDLKVVDALLSNTSERSKTVTLVFEREVAEEDDSPKEDAVAAD